MVEFRSKYKNCILVMLRMITALCVGILNTKIFCFHWSGKEFRMLCFFAKHDSLHIAMQI